MYVYELLIHWVVWLFSVLFPIVSPPLLDLEWNEDQHRGWKSARGPTLLSYWLLTNVRVLCFGVCWG